MKRCHTTGDNERGPIDNAVDRPPEDSPMNLGHAACVTLPRMSKRGSHHSESGCPSRGPLSLVRPEITGQLAILCALALVIACGQSEPFVDAGPDSGTDARRADAAKCTVPEPDGAPTYRWSFDQQTLQEDNGLI